jgi:hypothetical protein
VGGAAVARGGGEGRGMTEQEWLACTDPEVMLDSLRGKASDRKLRLFAVGCCRRVWASIKDERFRTAIQRAELFADGMVTKEEMTEARDAALPAFVHLHSGEDEAPAAALSAAGVPAPEKSFFDQLLDAFSGPWWENEFDKGDPHAPAVVTAGHAAWAAAHAQGQRPLSGSAGEVAERQQQAGMLRDIFGNPFRLVSIPPAWQTSQVVAVAQAAYEQRELPAGTLDTTRLAVLADALEEAGCTGQEVIGHLRGPGPHVRGCWAVDLILGKQ